MYVAFPTIDKDTNRIGKKVLTKERDKEPCRKVEDELPLVQYQDGIDQEDVSHSRWTKEDGGLWYFRT